MACSDLGFQTGPMQVLQQTLELFDCRMRVFCSSLVSFYKISINMKKSLERNELTNF